MQPADYDRFVDVLNGVLDVLSRGRERTDISLALWWKALEPFDLNAVEGAMALYLQEGTFAPVPADIIRTIRQRDGRPTGDEAWAMIPRSEYESVCWTDEMSVAYGIAAPLLDNGDQVAARRAFIDKYEREVEHARRLMRPVKTWFSWGRDAGGRQSAVEKAVAQGLITRGRAVAFLPAPDRDDSPLPQVAVVAANLRLVQ